MVLKGWDGNNLRHAAALLLAARESFGAGAWSFVEVLDNDDFVALRRWARDASPSTIEHLLRSTDYVDLPAPRSDDRHPKVAVIGLALGALFAMAAGRSTTTSAPWKAVAEVLEGAPIRPLVIAGAGPTALVREALITAARAFELRSGDLDASDEHRWYHLLRLQGGIPPADLVNLPTWLDVPHVQPRVVRDLASVSSFAKAWSGLLDFRRGYSTRDAASRALRGCPFFGASYSDVLDAARKVRESPAPRPPATGIEGVVSAELMLVWKVEDSVPRVLIIPRVNDDASLGPRVEIEVDGEPRLCFRRRDGVLRPFGSAEIDVPVAPSYSVTARSGGEPETVMLDLVDADSPITLFDRAGRRTDSEGCAAFLVSPFPLERSGVEGRYFWAENARLAVAELVTGVKLSLGGVLIWPTAPAPPPFEIVPIAVVADPSARTVAVTLEHPAHVVVRAAFGCGERFAVDAAVRERDGLVRTVVRGIVHAKSVQPELPVLLRLRVGDETYQRTLRVRTFSAAAVGGSWLDPTLPLERRLMEGGAVSVQLGAEHMGRDARLVALGSWRHLPPNGHGRASLRVAGYGEPLRLVGGPSWEMDAPSTVLAASIVDHGQVRSHACTEGGLVLRHAIGADFEADDDHWLLVWPRTGPLQSRTLRASDEGPSLLVADWSDVPPRAVALCYGRHVLGTSWDPSWAEDLGATGLAVPKLLVLFRLLHLPLLAPEAWPHVSRWLEPHVAVVIGEYGSESVCLDVGEKSLVPSETEELWRMVRRWVLLDLRLREGAQVEALKDLYVARHGKHSGGVAAVDGEIAAARKWFYAFVGSLLAGGALVPTDGYRAAKQNNFGKPLLDCSLGLRDDAGGTPTKVGGRRKRRVAEVRASMHAGLHSVLVAVRQIKDGAPVGLDGVLANALLDERTSRLVHVELLVDHVLQNSEK